MNRREMMGTMIGAATAAHLYAPAAERRKPNVLIIQTDEHNFRTLGCYRDQLPPDQANMWGKGVVVETPHLDRIAAEGAICNSYYSSCPVCTPSRASFMTGLYPVATGSPKNDLPLHDGLSTFATVLKDQGYATSYVGKWHLDGDAKPGFGPARQFGFSDNRYMMNRGHWKGLAHDADGKPMVIDINKEHTNQSFNVSKATDEDYTTDFLTNRALEILERDKESPFCMVISIPDPHDPNAVRPPYNTRFSHLKFEDPRTKDEPKENKPKWALGRQEEGLKQKHMQDYFGMVQCIDDNVGRLLQFLEDNGLDENTIVVFSADHGDMLYEHNRRNKGMPYESSAKIPYIVRWPERIRPGKVINTPYNTSDFAPTLLGMMGMPPIPGAHGRNDASAFLSTEPLIDNDQITYVSGPSASWIGAFTHRYKLVITHKDEPWLFDLESDPDELVNYAKDPSYKAVVQRLQGELKKRTQRYKDPALSNALRFAKV